MMMMRLVFLLLSSFLLLDLMALVRSEPTLTEIHVITRHGSRLPLTKDADSLDEGGPGTLTPLGQKMHYDLGTWLRERYNNGTGFFNSYFSSRVVLQSSSLQRTVVSANSLAYGLFPAFSRDTHNESVLPYDISPNVPVFSEKTENDVTIRGYEKCELGIGLEQLYVSPEWKSMENDHLPLLEKIGKIDAFSDYYDPLLQRVPLEQLWNVYDAIDVVKTECGFNPYSVACRVSNPDLENILSDSDWTELKSLAFKAELMKYNSKTAGKLAGGLLLQMILSRMQANILDNLNMFYLYSAHYPTILGVLAALESDPQSLIPSYAAALIFELYTDVATTEKTVRILYKQGYETNSTDLIKLGQGCSGASDCELGILNSSFIASFSPTEWCDACKYNMADICFAANLTAVTAKLQQQESENSNSSIPAYGAALVGLFVGMTFGALAMLGVLWYRRTSAGAMPKHPVEGEPDDVAYM